MISFMLAAQVAYAGEPIDVLRARLKSSRTGIVILSNGGSAQSWRFHQVLLRYDKAEKLITVDFPTGLANKRGRYHWSSGNGTRTEQAQGPAPLPAGIAAVFGTLADELANGFGNTDFTRLEGLKYRVDFPGPQDDSFETVLSLHPGGFGVQSISIHDSKGDPLSIGGLGGDLLHVELYTDVPLHPDTYQVEPTVRYEVSPRLAGSRLRPQTRSPWSFAELETMASYVLDGSSEADLSVPSCTKGQVEKRSVQSTWKLTQTEAARVAAAQSVCDVTLDALGHASHNTPDGVRSCLSGQLTLRRASNGAAISSESTKSCTNGKVGEESYAHMEMILPVPPKTPVSNYYLDFEGEVSVECLVTTSETTHVQVGFQGWEQPKLSWFGCYPGWGFEE